MIEKRRFVCFCIIISLCVCGCLPRQVDEEPIAVDYLSVQYQDGRCIYDGPSIIRNGEIKISFDNLTDKNLVFNVFLISEGYSYQDIEGQFSGDTKNLVKVDWVIQQSGKLDIHNPNIKTFEIDPGTYFFTCAEILETGGWIDYLGSQLNVE